MAPQKLEGLNLGKYQLREQLGRGGMADVYRAYHPQLDRFVAIKVLRGELVEDEEFLARFQREAKIVAALRHPNIVQVFDADAQDNIYYMVMELLEGDSLKARLTNYRARSEGDGRGGRLMLYQLGTSISKMTSADERALSDWLAGAGGKKVEVSLEPGERDRVGSASDAAIRDDRLDE